MKKLIRLIGTLNPTEKRLLSIYLGSNKQDSKLQIYLKALISLKDNEENDIYTLEPFSKEGKNKTRVLLDKLYKIILKQLTYNNGNELKSQTITKLKNNAIILNKKGLNHDAQFWLDKSMRLSKEYEEFYPLLEILGIKADYFLNAHRNETELRKCFIEIRVTQDKIRELEEIQDLFNTIILEYYLPRKSYTEEELNNKLASDGIIKKLDELSSKKLQSKKAELAFSKVKGILSFIMSKNNTLVAILEERVELLFTNEVFSDYFLERIITLWNTIYTYHRLNRNTDIKNLTQFYFDLKKKEVFYLSDLSLSDTYQIHIKKIECILFFQTNKIKELKFSYLEMEKIHFFNRQEDFSIRIDCSMLFIEAFFYLEEFKLMSRICREVLYLNKQLNSRAVRVICEILLVIYFYTTNNEVLESKLLSFSRYLKKSDDFPEATIFVKQFYKLIKAESNNQLRNKVIKESVALLDDSEYYYSLFWKSLDQKETYLNLRGGV